MMTAWVFVLPRDGSAAMARVSFNVAVAMMIEILKGIPLAKMQVADKVIRRHRSLSSFRDGSIGRRINEFPPTG